jgi:hypothetical protein
VESVKEQRICVEFFFKVGKAAAETNNMLHEAYRNNACFASPQEGTTGALMRENFFL